MSSIYEVLGRDHVVVADLASQLAGAPPEGAYKGLIKDLVMAGSRHEAAEEMVLWPAVRRNVHGGDALADHALGQEREARYLLDALRFSTDGSRGGLIEEFATANRTHVAFEEDEVWPELRQATTRIGASLFGAEIVLAKKLAPTRPHPHGPDRPLGLSTKGAAAAVLDRMRDKVSGRRP